MGRSRVRDRTHSSSRRHIRARGDGNAVLIKSGVVFPFDKPNPAMLDFMLKNNLCNGKLRVPEKLCSGQTLLCRSLSLKVKDWNQKNFEPNKLYIADVKYKPKEILQGTRLGIPKGRDEHLPYRFVDKKYESFCTKRVSS